MFKRAITKVSLGAMPVILAASMSMTALAAPGDGPQGGQMPQGGPPQMENGQMPSFDGELPELPPEFNGEMPPEFNGELPPEFNGEMPQGQPPVKPDDAPELPEGELPALDGELPELPPDFNGELPELPPEFDGELPEDMPAFDGERPELPADFNGELPEELPAISEDGENTQQDQQQPGFFQRIGNGFMSGIRGIRNFFAGFLR